MIEAKSLSRSFTYNGVKLPDPDPRMTPEEVKAVYSHQYPELATAAITGHSVSSYFAGQEASIVALAAFNVAWVSRAILPFAIKLRSFAFRLVVE